MPIGPHNSRTIPRVDDNGDGTHDPLVSVSGAAALATATFTRPADTTPYASGDLVANSTTAGSVTPLQLTAARMPGGSFLVNRLRLRKSGSGTTNATFRAHLFSAAPTVANGDNGALSMTGSASYIGRADLDLTQSSPFSDGAAGQADTNFLVSLASGQVIWALIEARGAYTPVSAETFTLAAEVAQN